MKYYDVIDETLPTNVECAKWFVRYETVSRFPSAKELTSHGVSVWVRLVRDFESARTMVQ